MLNQNLFWQHLVFASQFSWLIFVFTAAKRIKAYVKSFDENSTYLVPQGLHITEEQKLDEVGAKVKEFYLKKGETFTAHNRSLIKVRCIVCWNSCGNIISVLVS